MRSACALSAASGSGVSVDADDARGLDEPRLIGLGGKREHLPLALGRAGFFKRATRERRDRLAGNAGAAADADGDDAGSWLDEPPLHDRHRRAPAGIAPDRLGMRDRDLRKLSAPARAPVDARGLRLQRHRVDDQPSARRERIAKRVRSSPARWRRRR